MREALRERLRAGRLGKPDCRGCDACASHLVAYCVGGAVLLIAGVGGYQYHLNEERKKAAKRGMSGPREDEQSLIDPRMRAIIHQELMSAAGMGGGLGGPMMASPYPGMY